MFDFIEDENEIKKLLDKQSQEDENWVLIQNFIDLINKLLVAVENNKLNDIRHEYDWWQGYFSNNLSNDKDSFPQDLKIMSDFLENAKAEGQCNAAFYSE